MQKIQSYFRDEATQRAVLAALAEEFPELSVACSLPGNVELTHRDATKGAAMGNAAPEAKAAARLVTGTNQEDGVARTLLRLLEEGA